MSATRILFRIAVAILWVFVALLAVEIFERARWALIERDAATYMSTRDYTIPGMRPATPEEEARIREKSALPTPVPVPAAELADPNPATALPANDGEIVQRFEALRPLSPADLRHARATREGEFFALYDASGKMVERFGDPYFERTLLVGTEDFLDDSLGHYSVLREIMPGQTMRSVLPSHPVWDYEARRLDLPGVGSLFYIRLLHVHTPFEEIARMAAYTNDGTTMIPQFNYLPNINNGWCITDQFGYKNKPVAVPKPEGVIRIVCFGGSTTEDADVGLPRTTDYLQELLSADFPSKAIEVINCGVSGNTSFELRRKADEYLKYQPDLMIYYEGINDLVIMLQARRGVAGLLASSHAYKRWFNESLAPSNEAYTEYWENGLRRNLATIQLAAEEAGVPMAAASFVYPRWELLNQHDRNFIASNTRTTWGAGMVDYPAMARLLEVHNERLRAWCSETGVGYIPLAENYDYGMSHFKDFCHFFPAGMQERARVMQAWLKPWVEARINPLGG